MKNGMIAKLAALALFGSAAATAANIVYSNTTTDTIDTVLYSLGPYAELGDQIHLAGTDRTATLAVAQFYNIGAAGTFDAILRLYDVGSPVGSQIGSSVTVTGISAPGGCPGACPANGFNVNFVLNTTVPTDLIFTLAIANASMGTDIGVEMFEPPGTGTSNNQFMIGRQGGIFSQLATLSENVFFELDAITASGVPEPSAFVMLGCGLVCLLAARKRLRKS